MYRIIQKTANPSLLIAVCVDCDMTRTILNVLQYLRNSQSAALCFALLNALVEQDCPSARVLVHQLVLAGVLGAGFTNYVQSKVFANVRVSGLPFALQLLGKCAETSEWYSDLISGQIQQQFVERCLEQQNYGLRMALYHMCAGLLVYNCKFLGVCYLAVAQAILDIKC